MPGVHETRVDVTTGAVLVRFDAQVVTVERLAEAVDSRPSYDVLAVGSEREIGPGSR